MAYKIDFSLPLDDYFATRAALKYAAYLLEAEAEHLEAEAAKDNTLANWQLNAAKEDRENAQALMRLRDEMAKVKSYTSE